MKSDHKILEKELSYKIYGVFIKVGRDYGYNLKEEVYQKACEEELEATKIKYKAKPTIPVLSKKTGKVMGNLFPDIVVEDKILVEIKALKNLKQEAEDQLIKYLELSKYEVGYLVNFGRPYTEIIRKVYSNNK